MDYFIQDIFPGYSAKLTSDSLENETKIDIHNNTKNISHSFSILQNVKEQKAYLLDKDGNTISSFDLKFVQHNLENVVKMLLSTYISVNEQPAAPKKCIKPIRNQTYHHHYQPNDTSSTAFTGYTPLQIQEAYGVFNPVASCGVNPVITIVIAYSYPGLQSDFDIFCSTYNLPPTTLNIVSVQPDTQENSSWSTEECLDTQWSYAMCPNATIQVVEAFSDSTEDLFAAVQYATNPPLGSPLVVPNVVSMSWGMPEYTGQTDYDSFFSNTSICYLAAAGDSNYPSYPATSPNVLAVGGTTLNLNSENQRTSETTWDSAGCGESIVYTKPSYQQNISTISQYTNEIVPDLAAVGNPNTGVVVIYQGSPTIVGGTSVATPLTAGILATPLATRVLINKPSLTTVSSETTNSLQEIIYSVYNTSSYDTNFYDVTSGSDGNYTAGVGFDVPTGLGVQNACQLALTILSA